MLQGDYIISDKLNHASLIDGSIISRANFKRYEHNDYKKLEELLKKNKTNNKLIISDSYLVWMEIFNLKKSHDNHSKKV